MPDIQIFIEYFFYARHILKVSIIKLIQVILAIVTTHLLNEEGLGYIISNIFGFLKKTKLIVQP